MLAKTLGTNSSIFAYGTFPFETRFSQYAYIWDEVYGRAKEYGEGLDHCGFEYQPFQGNDENDYRWLTSQKHVLSRVDWITGTQSFYQSSDDYKTDRYRPRYVLEKVVGHSLYAEILEKYSNVKVLLLLRDPRSIFLSVRKFNQQRGYKSFGEEKGTEFLLSSIVEYCKHSLKICSQSSRSYKSVWYEDVIKSPQKTYASILSWLGLGVDKTQLRDMISQMEVSHEIEKKHITSRTLSASLKKWETYDISSETKELFDTYDKDFHELGL